MIKELIVCFLLLLIGCVLVLKGREIRLENRGMYLRTKASLKEEKYLDLKLSFDSNRLKVRRKNRFFPFLDGSSYSSRSMPAHTGKFCPNSLFNERAFVNSLSFHDGIEIEDLQLIFTDDSVVSDWWDWNGVLGLNPFDSCIIESNSLDTLAPLNQMRGNFTGLILDTGKLIFTNENFQGFELPLDGMFFEMEQISFGDFNFGGVSMKGKLDLESRWIKIPAVHYDEICRKFSIKKEHAIESSDKITKLRIEKRSYDLQISIQQPSQGKLLNFPLKRYWKSETLRSAPDFANRYYVNIAFEKHDKPYWSFGLMFLEDFRVFWDLNRKRIVFEGINSS